MKMIKFMLIIFVLIELAIQSIPSQATRNYRRRKPDPSFNPLPATWETGARNALPLQRPDKYNSYNSKIHKAHAYMDKTTQMREKARAKSMVLQ